MRYLALACDGDGTLMRGERLGRGTIGALERVRESGRKLFLVTGERPPQLAEFPHRKLFDLIVGEDGGILYWPKSKQVRAAPPEVANMRLQVADKKGPQSVANQRNPQSMLTGSTSSVNSTPSGGFTAGTAARSTLCSIPGLGDCNWK